MSTEDFKQNVELLIEILKEEKDRAKELSELRSHKKRLKESIGQYMVTKQIEEAVVPDTATLMRVPKRRILALKRQAVESWAKGLLGDERSLQEVGKLYDSRDVKTVEDIVVGAVTEE